jgi:hypothetical protein
LGLVPLLGWNRQGTARFVEQGGAGDPASNWNEQGTWPTSDRPVSIRFSFAYVKFFFVFSSPGFNQPT